MPRTVTKQHTKCGILFICVLVILKGYSIFDDFRFVRDAVYEDPFLIWIHIAANIIEPIFVAVSIYMIPTDKFDKLIQRQHESSQMYFLGKCRLFVQELLGYS